MLRVKRTTATGAERGHERDVADCDLCHRAGWWGLSRHFHYVPEIAAAFLWTLPNLFDRPLAYFYVVFLTLLLTDRAFRDDTRCRAKYGSDWDKYCRLVPYRMLPGVF